MTQEIDINAIKKDLYKTKTQAKFYHYSSGKLYYEFDALDGTFIFPIEVTEKVTKTIECKEVFVEVHNVTQLSSDLGSTNFGTEIKASDLNRWILKAFMSDELIKIK